MDLTSAAAAVAITGDEAAFSLEEDDASKSSASTPASAAAVAGASSVIKSELAEAAIKPTDTDFELAQKSAAGNMAAFERIYERYHRRTYSLCLRMTNSATEAEDLTQEVFIQLFRKIGSFRGESAFSTWLHRMTINQVLMHFRRRGVQNEKTTEDGEMPEQIVRGTENHNKMPILDRLAIDKAISELPNGYRTVFVLHDVEGFEHEEIARMLGLSVGTSKSQLHKARLKLRTLLKKVTENK
jgi:RNA polymerase sigma-70 factor, ECF subfamily